MDAAVLLGGPKEEWPADLKEQLKQAQAKGDLLIGVDRGALLLLELGFKPDLAIGDFDSLKADELAWVEGTVADIRYSVPKKDWTDSELMLGIAFGDYKIDQLKVYGATGGRLDHVAINAFGILNPDLRKYANQLTLIDKQNLIFYRQAGSYEMKKQDYSYFGVTCLLPVEDLTIEGALYDLAPYSGDYLRSFTSNEFLPDKDSCRLSLKKGLVAVVYSKDLDRYQMA
ncbi:thiamine diphosphokinase [Lactobacillus delbrueckii subsp. bulgaricus]|uniref:thiamine diphosphokinase n=1 Tax=Lactobacillus delbrueckii TaxID=1584 RepID=UPI0012E121AA|nr:thiamine diphosphokinase [Lactobacillus delbrueckii]MBT9064233.1 thiamine diphosphokinase [Lactobacillus delbrueckii subsp. bulgaricus]MBT9070807.1 thiamine diphosphokinase [Lactobacillus delbrueckii subsp. bulgaricus]MCD5451077.1 thiamine diphosphokinase [Lactobacillus delbrueckii subsp. lactis]MDA3795836.1 thiamine diphosphokinase [Lactobacillus delbrueckii]QGT61900.1 thiamine diphosphokinase [Lactobacillus delbrueckii]